ncbi:MAG: preprotein translocase subunit SecA [Alphaproteobacteria bacterium]|nr:preprotein translocase subunit SecA [Alphaproteobacteria bacterium]
MKSLDGFTKRLFGTANSRYLRGLMKTVDEINALEPELEALSDDALRAKTDEYRKRLGAGEVIEDLLVEAFAVVREASKRTLGLRHFDVQMQGGMVLHQGKIAEMKTGEGKTLVATLSIYLNALEGKGAHVVTVNDYLAQRDAEWMGHINKFLGLSVGVIIPGLDDTARREAYGADVTYGTNNEFGFDYLRDNMKFRLEDMVQREFNFAIVDEVDSILIDEARTPLIISGPAEDSSDKYISINKFIPILVEADYERDEKARSVTLTEDGIDHAEELLRDAGLITEGTLYDIANISLLHHINQALAAHKNFKRDKEYIVKDGNVVLIDEFTGRMMEGRRLSDGLHQAIEAKEGVNVQIENQTLASITFQNYFRLYPTLAGMTGTAMTEAGEFSEIYHLDVIDIPTNVLCIRDDTDDEVYRTLDEKYAALIDLIDDCQKRGQPTLVGTVSIEKSEHLADMLKKRKIKHNVLNARFHEQEATIIAQAGAIGNGTIATNMAGRGTDIQLGGNVDMRIKTEIPEGLDEAERQAAIDKIRAEVEDARETVKQAGGLAVIGTERHESRRIDNQLRGRSGRQGDEGASRFYLSLEDDLMRIFGSERMDGILRRLGLQEGEAIVHPWINKALEKAQQKVEARNFEIRKQLLQYDDVMNDQRKVIYEQRKDLMRTDDVSETVLEMRAEVIDELVARCIPAKTFAEQWDAETLHTETTRFFGLDIPFKDWFAEEGIAEDEVEERLTRMVEEKMASKVAQYGAHVVRLAEKSLLLQLLDHQWKDHLLQLDHLRRGIGLRAYAQKNPLNEYKREAFEMFQEMLIRLREHVIGVLSHLEIQMEPEQAEAMMQAQQRPQTAAPQQAVHPDAQGQGVAGTPAPLALGARPLSGARDPDRPESWGKVPRNAPCPCGSGKKYKHCHGAIARSSIGADAGQGPTA